jgi:hypothetical protein
MVEAAVEPVPLAELRALQELAEMVEPDHM